VRTGSRVVTSRHHRARSVHWRLHSRLSTGLFTLRKTQAVHECFNLNNGHGGGRTICRAAATKRFSWRKPATSMRRRPGPETF